MPALLLEGYVQDGVQACVKRLTTHVLVFHSTRKNFAALMENDKDINSAHVKRYVGHVLDLALAKRYSAGMRPENRVHVADAARYSVVIE